MSKTIIKGSSEYFCRARSNRFARALIQFPVFMRYLETAPKLLPVGSSAKSYYKPFAMPIEEIRAVPCFAVVIRTAGEVVRILSRVLE